MINHTTISKSIFETSYLFHSMINKTQNALKENTSFTYAFWHRRFLSVWIIGAISQILCMAISKARPTTIACMSVLIPNSIRIEHGPMCKHLAETRLPLAVSPGQPFEKMRNSYFLLADSPLRLIIFTQRAARIDLQTVSNRSTPQIVRPFLSR